LVSTWVAAGQALNAIARHIPSIMGGSGDLNPSTNTVLKEQGVHDRPGAKTLMAQLARWFDGSRITMKSSQGV